MLLQKHPTIYETLKRIGDAEQRKLDTWSISLTSGEPNAPKSPQHPALDGCDSHMCIPHICWYFELAEYQAGGRLPCSCQLPST